MKFPKDLTLFFIHGNGIPRSFRLSLLKLRTQMMLLIGVFLLLFVLTLAFSSIYIYERYISPTPLLTADRAKKLEEIGSLEKMVAELQQELEESRLGQKSASPSLLPHLLAPTEALRPSSIAIEKLLARHHKNKISLKFTLKNALPNGEKAKGYVLSLLRTKDSIRIYPQGVFRPTGKLLLAYNKGKFFSIVRLVHMQIDFENINNEKDITLQLLIFSTTGKLLYSSHIKEVS